MVVRTPAAATALLALLGGILVLQMPHFTRFGLAVLGLRAPTRHHMIVLSYLILVNAAFLPVMEGYDPLREGLTARRAYELGLLVMATALAVVHGSPRGLRRLEFPRPEVYVLLTFALLGLASASWSPNPILTLAKAGQLVLIVLGTTSLVPLFRKNGQLLDDLPGLAGISTLVVLVAYLVLNYFLWGAFLASVTTWEGGTRLVLGYAHTLAAGNFASLGTVCLMASNRSAGARLILAVPLLLVVWLASARGPAAGLIAAAMVLVLLRFGSRARLRYALQLAFVATLSVWLLIAIGGLISPRDVAGIVEHWRPESIVGISGRWDLWRFTLDQVRDRPFLGVGYEAGRYVLLRYAPFAGVAHNSFLDVLVGTGFLGFTLLVVFSIELVRMIWWTRDPLLAGLATYAYVYAMTNPIIFVPSTGMILVTLAVIRAAFLKRASSTPYGLPFAIKLSG